MSEKEQIKFYKKLTKEMVKQAVDAALEKMDKAFMCGAFDINNYGLDYELPKIVASALLDEAAWQASPLGTENKITLAMLKKML